VTERALWKREIEELKREERSIEREIDSESHTHIKITGE
jgi:hypothetical protein